MVRRGFVLETPRSAEGQPTQLATADRTQKDEGFRDKQQGVLLQERTDEDPKRRGVKRAGAPAAPLESVSYLEAEQEGKQGSQERGVPAAMRRMLGDTPRTCSNVPLGGLRRRPSPMESICSHRKTEKAENCKSVKQEAAPEASAWQAVREARSLPLHPAANAEAGCYQLPSHFGHLCPGCRVTVANLFSLHPAQQIPLGIRKSFPSGLLRGRHGRKGPRGLGSTSLGPIQNETGNQLQPPTGVWAPDSLRTGTCSSCFLQDALGPGPALKHKQHHINTGRVSKALL